MEVLLPEMDKIVDTLSTMAVENADVPMMSRTHGSTGIADDFREGAGERGVQIGETARSRFPRCHCTARWRVQSGTTTRTCPRIQT